MVFLPLSVIAYAWLAQERIHVASLCTALFFIGFFTTWIYSSTVAYIVDANPGRSSAAVSMNSCFRGVAAFVFFPLSSYMFNVTTCTPNVSFATVSTPLLFKSVLATRTFPSRWTQALQTLSLLLSPPLLLLVACYPNYLSHDGHITIPTTL